MSGNKKIIYLMGTRITLYVNGKQSDDMLEQACAMLYRFEKLFSANSDQSWLAMLKKTAADAPVQVEEELYELIKTGRKHSLDGNSLLNIAIGPLIKLWRIGFNTAGVPDKEEISQVLPLLNPADIILNDENRSVFFRKKGMEIDLGAIAKGYFCDKIMDFFKANGAESAMIDIGGNVLLYGESPKGKADWEIGIQNPFLPRGNSVASVKIRNQSVVTSGIYERRLETNGQRYHHIFDDRSGYPVKNNIASLSIISEKSLDCDIFSSKLFGLDERTIIKTVNGIDYMEAIVITINGQMAITDKLKSKMRMAYPDS